MVLCTHKRSNWRQQRTLVHTPMRTRKNWRQQRAFPHTPTNAKKWRQLSTFPHSCGPHANIEGNSVLSPTDTRKHKAGERVFIICRHTEIFWQLRAFPFTIAKVKVAKIFSAYVYRRTLRQLGSLPYTHWRKNEGTKEFSTHTHAYAKINTANSFPAYTLTR